MYFENPAEDVLTKYIEFKELKFGDSEPVKAFIYPKLNALMNLAVFYLQF